MKNETNTRNFAIKLALDADNVKQLEESNTTDTFTLYLDRAAAWLVVQNLMSQLESNEHQEKFEMFKPCNYVISGLGGLLTEIADE